MKFWNKPEVQDLSINETANGFLDVNCEGPLNIVFGDKSNKNDSTPPTNTDTDSHS